jgi:uncharacterized DUF497 family protein
MLTLASTTSSSEGVRARAGSPRTSGALGNPETRLLAHKLQCNYTFGMSTLRFEWDERKAAANAKKHGVSFEEAKSVFVDEQAKLIDDPDHSQDEDRFVLLGLSSSLRLLVVCHCYRDEGNIIRFISARKATTQESRFYP